MARLPLRDEFGRRAFVSALCLGLAVLAADLVGVGWALAVAVIGAGVLANGLVANLSRVRRRIAQLAAASTQKPGEEASLETESLDRLASRLETARGSLTAARQKAELERDDLLGILEATSEGILVLGDAGRVEMLNDVARRLLSPAVDPLGRRLEEVIRERRVLQFAAELTRDGHARSRTLRLSDGTEQRVIGLSGASMPGRTGARRAVIVLRDLSELAHLESVRTDFVANVTHEMRSPLASILGYAELLEDDPALEEEQRNPVERILRNARRLDAIIRDLIELSRLEHGTGPELETVDLQDLLESIVSSYREQAQDAGLELALESRGLETPRRVDSGLLHQALANLVENAVKYSGKGAHVTVRASIELEEQVEVLRVAVEDDGPGIPPAHQQRIFERFYRVDSGRARAVGGTGLGLAIVKHACALHGGSIGLESSPEGSTFTVVVPAPI